MSTEEKLSVCMSMYIANFAIKLLGCDDEQLLATVVCAQLVIFSQKYGQHELYLLLFIFLKGDV